MRVAGSAVQFTSMNGLAERGLGGVNGAGHQALAGAGLAGDEDRRRLVERRDLAGLLQHGPNRGRFADHAREAAHLGRPAGGSRRAPA